MNTNKHDLSDDEFDNLFRESAEKVDINFDADSWKKMSQKLDAANRPPSGEGNTKSPFLRWMLILTVLLLLLTTGIYFMLSKSGKSIAENKNKLKIDTVKEEKTYTRKYVATQKVSTDKEEPKITNRVIANNPTLSTETTITDQEFSKSKATKNPVISVSADDKTSDKLASNASSNTGSKKTVKTLAQITSEQKQPNNKVFIDDKNKALPATKSPNNSERKLTESAMAVNQKGSTNNVGSSIQSSTNEIQATNQQSIADSALSQIETKRTNFVSVPTLSPKQHPLVIHLELPVIAFEAPALAPQNKPTDNTLFKRGFSVRLALSPDFSVIPSNKLVKVGNNWAALVEYRLNNRLSFQTGVIRSLKLYDALPSQYEWNSYWPQPNPLVNINATCKMLDIPVNVRYDLSKKPNIRWFVSTGLTSYIMLNEKYRYNYENPSDPNIKRRSWEGETGSYPFSVLNISTGYERQIFRRLSLQAEPFFKAPLGKVGYGKVRLATVGVFFSVKYPL